MRLPAGIEKAATKFNQMSLRERALVAIAAFAAVLMTWVLAIYDPIAAKERALASELTGIQDSIDSTTQTLESIAAEDPAALALIEESSLKERLGEIDAQLDLQAAGLIPPERMVEVIHDVLSRQHGVKLISLHNKPVTSLVQPIRSSRPGEDAADSEDVQIVSGGPYMHPVELVVEGRYLDVLAYLRALEGLSWRFYWKVLELRSTEYPLNRVSIKLGTLSMDKDWIGFDHARQ